MNVEVTRSLAGTNQRVGFKATGVINRLDFGMNSGYPLISGDATERAYRRGDALEKRRGLMEAWAQYLEPGPASNVVRLAR